MKSVRKRASKVYNRAALDQERHIGPSELYFNEHRQPYISVDRRALSLSTWLALTDLPSFLDAYSLALGAGHTSSLVAP